MEVQLNGRPLARDTDYRVDFTGSVTFVGNVAQEVADPGADLEISFESEDVFNIGSQQKTLLGLRTEYEFWGGDGRVGSTMIYNNERSSDRRVRVGNEPKRTVIWNFDLRARREVPVLTRVVDMLPLVKTAVPSEVTLDAEVAQSRPNLNTKGRGYIDDFEASEQPTSLVVNRTRWAPASAPDNVRFGAENRAPFIWYNPYDGVLRTDIWPNQEEQIEAQNRRTDILSLALTPLLEAPESLGGNRPRLLGCQRLLRVQVPRNMGAGPRGHLALEFGRPNQRGLHRQRPPRHRRRAFPRAGCGRRLGIAGGRRGH